MSSSESELVRGPMAGVAASSGCEDRYHQPLYRGWIISVHGFIIRAAFRPTEGFFFSFWHKKCKGDPPQKNNNNPEAKGEKMLRKFDY